LFGTVLIMQSSRAVLLLSLSFSACAVEPDDLSSETFAGDPVVDPLVGYDFTCVGKPLPDRAAEVVMLSGFTNDSYTGGGLGDVAVELFGRQHGDLLDATASDDGGVLGFELATSKAPIDLYARMTRPGHVDSYLYRSRPLTADAHNVFFPVLPPAWREELAGHAGVTLDPTTGIVGVIVVDCAGARVAGAEVTFDPPADAVAYWDPTFTNAAATRTTLNGHAWGFNVPAGPVRATVTIGHVVYRDWPVHSFADSRTLSWRAP
jgi:hypothetical protein